MFKSFTAGDTRSGSGDGKPGSGRPAPLPLLRAARLMYAGAAATVVYAIFVVVAQLVTKNEVISLYRSQAHGKPASVSQLNGQFVGGVVTESLLFLVIAGLWVAMARLNLSGRGWARIASSALFILWTLSTYGTIGETAADAILIVNTILTLAIWAIGLGAVFLIWRPESGEFFKDASAR